MIAGSAENAARSRAPVIAVTTGEPAGIGPEICMQLAGLQAAGFSGARIVLIGDAGLLAARSPHPLDLIPYRVQSTPAGPGAHSSNSSAFELLHIGLRAPCTAGRLDPGNSPYVLELLERALSGCMSGEFSAMVTAPVSKAVINDAGIPFTGHTEFLADRTGTPRVVMLLVGGGLRVALATTHVPLSEVSPSLTRDGLEQVLRILVRDLRSRFGIEPPRVLVAGLNPHAGEGGHLGHEDAELIAPVVRRLRDEGFAVEGPLPADTLFVPSKLAHADCVLAMYHDQGLPVLKYASFGGGVNVTLGLPFIRTSVDHGTALDIAGLGRADPGSLIAAVRLAIELAVRQRIAGSPT